MSEGTSTLLNSRSYQVVEKVERNIVFSRSKIPKLLLDFSLSLIHKNDSKANKQLKQIIDETEKYGKIAGADGKELQVK